MARLIITMIIITYYMTMVIVITTLTTIFTIPMITIMIDITWFVGGWRSAFDSL